MVDIPNMLKIGDSLDNITLNFIENKSLPRDHKDRFKPKWVVEYDSQFKERMGKDLNLKDLGELVAPDGFREAYSYILSHPVGNHADKQEQRATIQELMQDNKLDLLDKIIGSIYNLQINLEKMSTSYFESFLYLDRNINRRLEFLNHYAQTISDIESLVTDTKSIPMHNLRKYTQDLRASKEVSFLGETLETGDNRLELTLRFSITKNLSNFKVTEAKKNRAMPVTRTLYTLGHKFLAAISHMRPYRSAINMAVRELVKDNKKNIGALTSLLPQLIFYRSMINYEKAIGDEGVYSEPTDGTTKIIGLKHPIDFIKDKDIVPNDYVCDETGRLVLITGANNGGKSYFSKIIGIDDLIDGRGGKIIADEAEMPSVDAVYTHFVTQDDPINLNGRYKFELQRMDDILDVATTNSRIIVDEPCNGTDPDKGQVQSSYFVEALRESTVPTVFNTHFHRMAAQFIDDPGIVQIHPDTQFVDGDLIFNRTMIPGSAGTSYALELAQTMNLGREHLLKKARKIRDNG